MICRLTDDRLMTERTAELLGQVGLEGEASTVAWCPVNGVVAVGSRVSPYHACIYLVNVHCPRRKVSLHVPLQGPSDAVVKVCWSPAGSRRVLLAATLKGQLVMWSQQPADQLTQPHITMEDWWSHEPINLVNSTSSSTAAATADSSSSQLVAVSWLRSSPTWVWNSSAMQQVDFRSGSIHGLFSQASHAMGSGEDAAADSDLAFHWVRPGTLALAAVLSNGTAVVCWAHWSAYGHLQWNKTSSIPLQHTSVLVQAADVTLCSNGVAVGYTTQQEPTTVRVVELQGNPLHAQCCQLDDAEPVQLPVHQVALLSHGDAGSHVTALSWDPSSNGTRFVTVKQDGKPADTQTAGHTSATLTMWTLQQRQLLQLGQATTGMAPQQQQVVWLLDSMLACAQAQGLQVYQVDPLQQIHATFMQPSDQYPTGFGIPGAVLQSIAASPHGVAVAAVLQVPAGPSSASNNTRLLLYNVPAYTAQTAGPIRAAAGRLLYALMLQQHTWDVVQHTLCAACQPLTDARGALVTDGVVQPSAVAEVLALVDSKVTTQQPTLKSPYSALWDLLKLSILSATPGDEARAVGIDLRLRVVGTTLKPVFEVLREDASTRQRDARSKLPGLADLHSYLADLVQFVLACLKTWLIRRTSGSTQGGLAQHVPCIRHILDSRPCTLLVMLYVLIHSTTQGGKDETLYAAYKQFTKAAPASKDPNWEQVMRELIPGILQLHYADTAPECLNSLTLPPEQLLQMMDSNEVWRQQPVLTDADITAQAIRLGLLPVRPPRALAMCKAEQQLHRRFRHQLEEELGAQGPGTLHQAGLQSARYPRPNNLKRRRWEQQLGAAMGDSLGTSGVLSSGLFDLAHLMTFDADEPRFLQSVDCSVLAHEAAPALDDGGKTAPRAVVDQCAHGWMYACPISGEMWMREP